MEEHLIQNDHGNAVLLRLRGSNLYSQPNYRMVWSESRLWYLGGEWRKKYSNMTPCWVIEAWRAPEEYGDPIEWAKNDLGPFPHQGDYEFAIASPNDVFADISDDQAQRVIGAIERTAALTMPLKMSLYKQEQEAKLREQKRVLGDIVNDARPAIHSRIFEEEPHDSVPAIPTTGVHGSYIISPGDNA